MTEENKEKLFAEIKDQEIRYAIFQSEENLNYKLILKKNSNNPGIKQGVIIDLDLASEIVSQDLREIEKKLTYILPDDLIGIIWKGKFKGQIQKWFIVRFIGNESEININTKNPEFLEWKWINLEDLTKIAVNFKFNVYKNLKEEISKILS